MLRTEEEASQLWCPWARTLGTLRQPAKPGDPDYVVAAGSQNRGYAMGGALENCNCIASKCFAWEWAHKLIPSENQPRSEWVSEPTSKGYCRLIGHDDE